LATETAHQRALNRQTAGAWLSYAEHRENATTLLAVGKSGLRLCVLGAGNCNDLDVAKLAAFYRSITLVDLDAESLDRAVGRQSKAVRASLEVRAPVDVAMPDAVDRIGGGYDVVCSASVLSQLIDAAVRHGVGAASIVDDVRSVRAAHLAIMLELMRPSGRGLLVTEMVSSDTAPQIARTPRDQLPQLMAQLAAERNFFTGLNPFALEQLLKTDAALAPRISRTAFHPPWLWRLGQVRSYLAYALSFQRA
jgi:hypothetical protein